MTQTTTGKISALQWPWHTLLRLVLGIILMWKGINLFSDITIMEAVISDSGVNTLSNGDAILLSTTGVLTVIFGLFIALGLFVRITSFILLPIVSIEILFIHGGYIERNGFEMILIVIVTFLLLIPIAKGSDPLSDDDHGWQSPAY